MLLLWLLSRRIQLLLVRFGFLQRSMEILHAFGRNVRKCFFDHPFRIFRRSRDASLATPCASTDFLLDQTQIRLEIRVYRRRGLSVGRQFVYQIHVLPDRSREDFLHRRRGTNAFLFHLLEQHGRVVSRSFRRCRRRCGHCRGRQLLTTLEGHIFVLL